MKSRSLWAVVIGLGIVVLVKSRPDLLGASPAPPEPYTTPDGVEVLPPARSPNPRSSVLDLAADIGRLVSAVAAQMTTLIDRLRAEGVVQ